MLIALLMLPLAQGSGDGAAIQAGKAFWESFNNDCRLCHGVKGEGGFGPDLAGHRLTPAQFMRAVRKPWGIMPAFVPDKNITDQEIAQVAAYLASLPKVAEPSPKWFTPVPPLATERQELMISYGCGQCHSQTMANPRRTAGGQGADFEWFKREVYEHTTAPENANRPHLRMGNYSRQRVPEAMLQEIWQYFAVEAGLRVPAGAQINTGVPSANGVTYTITLQNTGVPGKGLTAEHLTLLLPLPPGSAIAAATGAGFYGLRRDTLTNAEAATWDIPSLAPGEKQTLTLTLSGSSAASGIQRGTVGWKKPALGSGGTDLVAVAVQQSRPGP